MITCISKKIIIIKVCFNISQKIMILKHIEIKYKKKIQLFKIPAIYIYIYRERERERVVTQKILIQKFTWNNHTKI